MTLTIIEHRKRGWNPRQTKLPRDYVVNRLCDSSRTLWELGQELGYSEKWLQHLSSLYEIGRKRGGDRKSAAARARYARA